MPSTTRTPNAGKGLTGTVPWLFALTAVALFPAAMTACRTDDATSGAPAGQPSGHVHPGSSGVAQGDTPQPAGSASSSGSGSGSGSGQHTSGRSELLLPAASVSAFQNPMSLPPYSGPTGSVEGTITVDGDPAPDVDGAFSKCPAARDMYGKLFREGPPLPNGARALADAFVGVTGYSGAYIPSNSEVRNVTIDNCGFTERTIDMTIGEHLEVWNKTRTLYAPTLLQVPTPALMLAPPGGDPVKLYPVKPAYYTLADKTGSAPYMVANVYVVAYPLHAISGLDGHYRIDGVPVGSVSVSARLAAIQKTSTRKVDVLANVVAHADLMLSYRKPNPGVPTPVPFDAGTNINY